MPDDLKDFVAAGIIITLCGITILLVAALDSTDMPVDTAKTVTEQAVNNSTAFNESANHLSASARHDSFERRKAIWAKRARARLH